MKELITPKCHSIQVVDPWYPSNILFMCLRHADAEQHKDAIEYLVANLIANVKQFTSNVTASMRLLAFWLSNMMHLLDCMRLYSTDEQPSHDSTLPGGRFKHFELSEYRESISELVHAINNKLYKQVTDRLNPLLDPCVLEYEGVIQSESELGMDTDMRPEKITSILEELWNVLVDLQLPVRACDQLLGNVFHYIGSACLNHLLLRRDLCKFLRSVNIQHNVDHLFEWARSNEILLEGSTGINCLRQACKMLQMEKKTEEDVDPILMHCHLLTGPQMQRLLSMYIPGDGEERVPANLIRRVIGDKRDQSSDRRLMIDISTKAPLTIPYLPANVKFNCVTIPPQLNLGFLEVY